MGSPHGTGTHKPNTLKRGANKFERDWQERERRRLKREAELAKLRSTTKEH